MVSHNLKMQKNFLNSDRSFTVRQATFSDAKGIASVHVQAWHEAYENIVDEGYLKNLSIDEKYESWRRILSLDNGVLHFVACDHLGKVIGFCGSGAVRMGQTHEENPPERAKGEVYAIYVLKEYHAQGVGSSLWNAATSFLKEKSLVPYVVWSLEDNHKGRFFYEKRGGIFQSRKIDCFGGKDYGAVCYLFEE